MNNRTTSRNSGKMMELPPPPLPNTARPRQMTLAEAAAAAPRGWDNGVGGYQTNTMLETRIGASSEGNRTLDSAPPTAMHCRPRLGLRARS